MSFTTTPDFQRIARQCWDQLSVKCTQVEDELQMQPHTLNRAFFQELNNILKDSPYTYLVNRDLKIAIYLP